MVLALLYLMLLAMLAVGFAAATTISVQIARNERNLHLARSAGDSGMRFIRYQLGSIILPAGTNSSNLLANVASKLGQNLNGTTNMGGSTVAVSNGAIYIPSQNGWINLDAAGQSRFRVAITQSGNNLVVTTHGCAFATKPITSGLQLQFRIAPFSLIGLNSITMSSNAFTDSYDASQGPYVASKTDHKGSIASNGNIVLSNNAKVDGDARCGVGKAISLQNAATITGFQAPLAGAVSYPTVTLPASYTDMGDINMSSGTISVPGGVYLLHNLNLSGTAHVIWTGPTTLYIQNSYSVSQNAQIDTYQNLPGNRTLNFLPTCTTATWSGTNVCVGSLYAPNTDFTVSGSVELFGRIIAKSIINSSSGGMHTDESLPAPGGIGGCVPIQGTYLEVP